jgi:small subunit ribosomal protein S20
MANIKSAKKRIKVIETKTMQNKIIKSALKTEIKKYLATVEGGNKEEANVAFNTTAKALDMASSKGVIHKNKASRTKSRLAARLNSINA